MMKENYEKENIDLIETLKGYLAEELDLKVISWLNELIEIVNRGMNDNNNSIYDLYLILPEDHERFQKLMQRVDIFYTDKYERLEQIERMIDYYRDLNFDVTEIDEIDYVLEEICEKEKQFNYSNNDKKKIKKLKKQLKDYQDVMSVLFYILDPQEKYELGYDIWDNLADEKDKKLLGTVIDAIYSGQKNFTIVMFHFFQCGIFRTSHSLRKLYEYGLPSVKTKMSDLSIMLQDKVRNFKLNFSLKLNSKDKSFFKENNFVGKLKDKIKSFKTNFSLTIK